MKIDDKVRIREKPVIYACIYRYIQIKSNYACLFIGVKKAKIRLIADYG